MLFFADAVVVGEVVGVPDVTSGTVVSAPVLTTGVLANPMFSTLKMTVKIKREISIHPFGATHLLNQKT